MSGKAYTMKEMKGIVEYITEHKAYAEIKGRKMWMDFANSKLTNRTWQSLKETFLKRILPDIYNPYYKLTMDQIRSFKDGYNVIAREKNKLEIIQLEDDSNAEKETDKPGTSHDNNGEAKSGEVIKCEPIENHDRASVDTVIITNCYETDEDLLKVLEESSPGRDNTEKSDAAPTKSLRDLITYSEPLTPMMQEVLNDIVPEDELEKELRIQTTENDAKSNPLNVNEEQVIEILDSPDESKNNAENKSVKNKNGEKKLVEKSVKNDQSTKNISKAQNDAEVSTKTNKTVLDNLKISLSKKDTIKENNVSTEELEKDKASGDSSNQKMSEEQVDKDKSANEILGEGGNDSLSYNDSDEAIRKNNTSEEDKNIEKTKGNISDRLEFQIEVESANQEDFTQPKVMSLKLRKRKAANEKINEKESSKQIQSKAEVYEIVKPGNLAKSSSNDVKVNKLSNDPEVDKLSNHLKNNDEIVSSTVSDKPTQNSSTSDTILPNNQEAFNTSDKRTSTEIEFQNDISKSPNVPEKVSEPKTTRKRARSHDTASTSNIKKNKLEVKSKNEVKAVSDTDDIVVKNLIKDKLAKAKLEHKKTVVGEVQKEPEIVVSSQSDVAETTKDVIPVEVPLASQSSIDPSQASELNPCLKSVSLYAEQFNSVSYNDSESEHETTPAVSSTDKVKDDKPTTSKTNENKDKSNPAESKEKEASKTATGTDKKIIQEKTLAMKVDDVVMLKSHSETESESNEASPPPRELQPASQREIVKVQRESRDQALANVFGFNIGGPRRKKRLSHRKNTTHHPRRESRVVSSYESSEWTSESDSEAYVSPPRGRRNKHARKYKKPKSADILSLDDEGGLFVMYGKKIYPLVKDGQLIKNYLTYLPESDPEEEESYWKLKYVEERQRVAELKKQIKEKNEENVREISPILPSRPVRLSSSSHRPESLAVNVSSKESSIEPVVIPEKESKKAENNSGKTLKITFTKNNQEVHVEGHWSNIHPVLAEVVHLMDGDQVTTTNGPGKVATTERPSNATSPSFAVIPSPVDEGLDGDQVTTNRLGKVAATKRPSNATREQSVAVIPSPVDEGLHDRDHITATNGPRKVVATKRPSNAISEQSVTVIPSPVDEGIPKIDILEKVNKLETEIFKEIEVRDLEEDIEEVKEQTETNVTKRQKAGRVKKSKSYISTSSVSSTGSSKGKKTSADEPKNEEQEETPRKTNKKPSKTEQKDVKKVANESLDPDGSSTSVVSKRTTRTTKKYSEYVAKKSPKSPNSEVKTRLRSTSRAHSKDSSMIDEDSDIRYMFPPKRVRPLQQRKSKDSSKYLPNPPQQYSLPQLSIPDESTQGYQDSDISPPKADRRKRKLSLSTVLFRNKNKSSRPKRRSFPCITDESSNDSNSGFKIIVRPSSNSSLKSEGYRSDSYQLLFPRNNTFKPLDKIDEDLVRNNSFHPNKSTLDNNGKILKVSLSRMREDCLANLNVNTEFNSSNVSLPLSPELSIVENLSVSKELLLNAVENYPTLNEMQANDATRNVDQYKYSMSQVDVSMPLMQQECGLHASINGKITELGSEDKVNTVEMQDAPSLSESLDARLRNLLLESAKKISMSVVEEEVQNEKSVKNEVQKKAKNSKRCSTPRKKREIKKRKLPIVDPVVEEEITESCIYGGRNSCPPVIQIINPESMNDENLNPDKVSAAKPKGRKKKDVIKVKILRPSKSRSRSPEPRVTRNTSKSTVNTDSGINESGLTVQGWNESVDLIHNHSETCLLANECNSVEFIENKTMSIISLNSDSATSPDRISNEKLVYQDCRDFMPDHFCENAQSFSHVDYVPDPEKQIPDNTSDTVYHSPVLSEASINSLITEDLSDETPHSSQPTKWYLFSEDDTSTNAGRSTSNSMLSSLGANLKQIFPITCAVPDLSTITETSNENGRKPTESANCTRHDLDSQSMFDNMNSN